jgi:plasmid replication initiation protein
LADGKLVAHRKASDEDQLDLFVAELVDVPVKGERETLSLPFFSLAKTKRARMTYNHGGVVLDVAAPSHIGVATLWDADVLLWCASELIAARERGRQVSPRMRLAPYELLRSIGRGTSGKHYAELRSALARLAATSVRTNVRVPGGERTTMFSWLEGWREQLDEKGRSQWLEITLPHWFFDAVCNGTVLTITPKYFQLSGGLERWLYRLVRRHAGNQEHGWTFSMSELHRKSGSSQALKYFARQVRSIVAANALPDYRLELVERESGASVHAVRRK